MPMVRVTDGVFKELDAVTNLLNFKTHSATIRYLLNKGD